MGIEPPNERGCIDLGQCTRRARETVKGDCRTVFLAFATVSRPVGEGGGRTVCVAVPAATTATFARIRSERAGCPASSTQGDRYATRAESRPRCQEGRG